MQRRYQEAITSERKKKKKKTWGGMWRLSKVAGRLAGYVGASGRWACSCPAIGMQTVGRPTSPGGGGSSSLPPRPPHTGLRAAPAGRAGEGQTEPRGKAARRGLSYMFGVVMLTGKSVLAGRFWCSQKVSGRKKVCGLCLIVPLANFPTGCQSQ